MPHRPRSDLPRLSGRPDPVRPEQERENPTVFRRFFDLLERFDRLPDGTSQPTSAKSAPPRNRGERR